MTTVAAGKRGVKSTARSFDVERVRADFPILKQVVHGRQLIYLDNAATTQKPQIVLDAIQRYYTAECANVHRGVHLLSERATQEYEGARTKIRRFLNAEHDREVIFVRGATEGINLVAASFGRKFVRAGDEVLITALEHHSNIVPWQLLCEAQGAHLRVVPINDRGEIVIEEFDRLLAPKTRLVAVAHVSNSLGTVNPLQHIIDASHRAGVPVLVDGAQAAAHFRVDVRELDCDFYVLSGHKMFGPTGIGVLYGKQRLLEQMPPYQGGGDMIRTVTFEKTTFNELPYKFEAGTPHVEGGIGLGAAVDYLESIDLNAAAVYERDLLRYGTEALSKVPGLRLIGTAAEKIGVLAFVLDGVHPHDIGTILDREGIAIRAGHHCAMPVMQRFDVPATARASLALYNTREEIDALVVGLRRVREVFA
jgi:cysteine desulfurase / selenocysteine lyase